MTNKKTLQTDIRKCRSICKALGKYDYYTAFINAKLTSDIWVIPIEEVNEKLHKNIQYDAENGTNFGCQLAKSLCKQLQGELAQMG